MDPAAVTPAWLRTSPYAWNSQDAHAWVARNGMGGDEVWWTLYVRKVYVGKWRTAAEAKAAYEQG